MNWTNVAIGAGIAAGLALLVRFVLVPLVALYFLGKIDG